ncbi:MAG: hypothetical protein IPM92_06340 [Saprospiraceae bacterium]|nr:hypothetical protein [Saprospiraceae bacterium]
MKKLEKYYVSPIGQGILALSIFLVLALFNFGLEQSQLINKQDLNTWLFATSLLFFYIMMSSIFCFNANNRMLYYRNAIFTYVGLALAVCLISSMLTGINLKAAASHSWIIYVLSIVYLVFMVIIAMIRKIVDLALKQK